MGSNLSRMTSLELIIYTECAVKLIYLLLLVGYCLLAIGISLSLSLSYPNKQFSLQCRKLWLVSVII
jgi:hypothetical protein